MTSSPGKKDAASQGRLPTWSVLSVSFAGLLLLVIGIVLVLGDNRIGWIFLIAASLFSAGIGLYVILRMAKGR